VDECTEAGDKSLCRPDEMCHNTVGSFVCRPHIDCGPGYRLNVSTNSCDGPYHTGGLEVLGGRGSIAPQNSL